jgi:hypothetical protein
MPPLRRWICCAALGLAACTSESDLGAPRIVSVTPAQMLSSESTRVEVDIDAQLPVTVELDPPSANVQAGLSLKIGQLEISRGTYEAGGLIRTNVPSVLIPGTYDVVLELEDGRTASLPQGFTVRPGTFPTAYALDAIGDQQRGVPFDVVIQAQGPASATFRGNLTLTANQGSVSPTVTSAFRNGRLTQQVTVSTAGTGVVLTFTDAEGHSVSSNPFNVN